MEDSWPGRGAWPRSVAVSGAARPGSTTWGANGSSGASGLCGSLRELRQGAPLHNRGRVGLWGGACARESHLRSRSAGSGDFRCPRWLQAVCAGGRWAEGIQQCTCLAFFRFVLTRASSCLQTEAAGPGFDSSSQMIARPCAAGPSAALRRGSYVPGWAAPPSYSSRHFGAASA